MTLHGSNLAPSQSSDAALLCRFGDRIVPARFETGASLTCASPLGAPAGQVYVSSSANGGASWSPSSARFVFYDLSRPLTLDTVAPASAAVAAAAAAAAAAGGVGGVGGLLNVSGSNFSPDPAIGALCTFSRFGGELGATPASYASPTQLRCASPPLLPGDAGAAALTLTALVNGAPATADYGRVVDTMPL